MARPSLHDENLEYINVGLKPSVLAPLRARQQAEGVPVSHQIRAAVEEMRRARPAVVPLVKIIPETMFAPCGDAEDFERLITDMGEGNAVAVGGRLSNLVTPNSFVARAQGSSMNGGPRCIREGDQLLMTPWHEFVGELHAGLIVLAILKYKNGDVRCSLKEYTGQRLKANNPRFKGVDFGKDVETATVLAVCRGILEKVFE